MLFSLSTNCSSYITNSCSLSHSAPSPPPLLCLFRTSRLRGKCEALLVVDLSASVSSGTTNDVPLPPSHLHSAYTFKAGLFFFFYCIAELAIKPCRSSRSKLRGEFGIPKHLQNRKQKHDKATPKHNTKQKPASVWNVKREVRRG